MRRKKSVARLFKAFGVGAFGYPLLELCWRGRTHPSMAAAGGASACWLETLTRCRSMHPWQRVLLGALGITGIEAVVGLVVNRRHQVWDYRKMPLQWRGQVCFPYSVAWLMLSWAYFHISDSVRR